MNKNQLIGAGGGSSSKSSKSRTPVEDPDSLQSHQYAQIVDLISEGPIRGLVNGLQSVYLNDTPIISPSGAANFSGVTLETRNGTNDQSYIEGFASVDNETMVGVELQSGSPIVRTISGDIDSATVTIGIPALSEANVSTGDIKGTSVSLTIEVQNNGGGYQAVQMGHAWSAFLGDGVSGTNITLNNCYGIGMTFTVQAPIDYYTYDSSADSGGGDYGGLSGGDDSSDGGGE